MAAYSVIIPAWQAESTIERAVQSALAQTLAPVEVAVCNDGSTDRTGELLAAFGDSIKVVTRENRGVSAASNAAARLTTGSVIVRLDADDEWLPNRLEAIEAHWQQNPDLGIVTTDATVVETGKPTYRYYETRDFPEPEMQRRAILRRNFIFASSAIRRDHFERVGGYGEEVPRQGEYELWVRLILSGSRVGLVPEPLAIYHRQEKSLGREFAGIRVHMQHTLESALRDFELSPEERRITESRLDEIQTQSAMSAALAGASGGLAGRKVALVAARRLDITPKQRLRLAAAALAPKRSPGRDGIS